MSADIAKSDGATAIKVCDECGQDFPYLQRHHIIARCEGGSNEETNIRLLCPNCHTLVHGGLFGGSALRERARNRVGKTSNAKPTKHYAKRGPEKRVTISFVLPPRIVRYVRGVSTRTGQSISVVTEQHLSEAIYGDTSEPKEPVEAAS